MQERKYPEVFEWVENYIPRLESIDLNDWAGQLQEALQIRDEFEALYAFERILRSLKKKEKINHRGYSSHYILQYLDWILIPSSTSWKLRKIGNALVNNLVVWGIFLALVAGIKTDPDFEGFVIGIAVCVALVWVYEYVVSFRRSPIYRSYLHLAGIIGALLGAAIGFLSLNSAVIFGIGGYAVGVFSGTVYSFIHPYIKRSI